jgi:uncharacterized protein (DUF2147 family)
MIFRFLFIFSLFFITPSVITDEATYCDKICGNWITERKDSVVKIFCKDSKYFGKVVWLREPKDKNGNPIKDEKNPNEKLRSREIKGIVFLNGFVYDSKDEKWENGSIYDPKTGDTYDAEITLASDDLLELRGYVGLPSLGRTVKWMRYKKK